MDKFLFLSSFRNLSITSPIEDHFTLLPSINISNVDSKKHELIDDRIAKMIGQVELTHLHNSPNFVFCEIEKSDFQELDSEKILLLLLLWIKNMFKSAWVLFDHSMDCDAAYLFHYNERDRLKCTSNFLAQRSTRSDSTMKEIYLDINDLQKWERIHNEINSYFQTKESGDFRFFMEKGYCRSRRALEFVDSARLAPNIGFKIAHYISAFEALFSTNPSELSHKLSERVAFFLGTYGYSKREVFQNMKAAYDVRSKLVHGATLSDTKIKDMLKISSCCDTYLRKIMNLLFGETNLKEKIDVSPNALDDFFDEMMFGSK